MQKYVDIISILIVAPLMIFSAILVIQAFRKKPNNVGSALRDSVNKFS